MAKSWKYYRANAEQFRGHNVFLGPLDPESGDVFIHYVRQGKLGSGTDCFGIFCEDHNSWFKVQPLNLSLKEISASEVVVPNKYTLWEDQKVTLRMEVADIGIEWSAEA